jgi:hypothetical membrane protein
VTGAARPDFDHVAHYISELGARGSSTEVVFRYGAFGFTGLLYLGFAAALAGTFPHDWLGRAVPWLVAGDGLGRLGAGVFPCDAGCAPVLVGPDLHRLFATIGFSAGVLAALACGVLCRRVPDLRSLSVYAVVSGVVAMVALVVLSAVARPPVPAGLLEHLATLVLSLWTLVLAARLIRLELGRSATAR